MDDKRAMHPKLCDAGFAARGVDEAAIELCASEETDGFIGDKRVTLLGAAHGESLKAMKTLIARLIKVDRWSRDDEREGYWIKDYLHYNPSHAELEAKRESDRKRKNPVADSKRNPSGIQAESNGNPDGFQIASTPPRGRARTGRVGKSDLQKEIATDDFEMFSIAYPRNDDQAKARQAFAKALKRTSFEAILAGAERYRDDPNRDETYTKMPTTWLNGDCWLNPPLPSRGGRDPNRTQHDIDRVVGQAFGDPALELEGGRP